ncbi:DNA-binding protein [Candidatus Atribacteria bacterium 1244-E10-H5-B2]|jgi:excisionase family DNA binding protein|nr:MAG: DNA-binding protein [Candidatus Atribacteria bacterium 1244-E10-H5-B2]RXG66916.1 MAG: DNA-binding protein [Candidatus Atribacteria bacterium 1244-E10-H5-B2]
MVIAVVNTKLYSVEDLVSMLNLSARTVRVYLREGKIKARKIGLSWYVTEENLQKFIEGVK